VGDSGQPSQSAIPGMSASQQQAQQHLQYLGDTSAALPDFGHVTLAPGEQFPRGVTAEHVIVFEQLYREHCEVCSHCHSLSVCLWAWKHCRIRYDTIQYDRRV